MRGRIVIAVLVALALVSSVGAGRATAGLNIDFNLIAQPQLVVVPGTPVAYAPALPANYFFYNGQYWAFASGGWYVSGGYNGPWVVVAPEFVPRPVLYVPVRYYHVPPGHWKKWEAHRPPHWQEDWGREWADKREWKSRDRDRDDDDRDDRRGKGKGKGKGHGNR